MSSRIFLVGFMGSGKTRVGKLLAKKLKWNWVDLDHEVVENAGMSIPELFASEGEQGFRDRERVALQTHLQSQNEVISCGGGVILRPENVEDLLKEPHVYCLRITPEAVFRRVGNDPRRPLLQGPNPYRTIKELMASRADLYARFPRQIDVDHLRTSEVVDLILPTLGNGHTDS
ncbi:MAG: shikimate kinase [Kiritimatiellae bacterium]|jgi:shikimate kinase|nr:shikimate kinase [Kiritimatiellia bacterium]